MGVSKNMNAILSTGWLAETSRSTVQAFRVHLPAQRGLLPQGHVLLHEDILTTLLTFAFFLLYHPLQEPIEALPCVREGKTMYALYLLIAR